MKKNKLIKRLLIVGIIVYAAITLINQQKTLNQYSNNTQELITEIANAQEKKDKLTSEKENVDSLEFIEQTAREKLDMYYPNERIYVDQGM